MKFVHMSDIRLGLHSESGRRWGKERVVEVKSAFETALGSAEAQGASLVLISGGLFGHRPVTTELSEANAIFSAHPGLTFVVIGGVTDPVRKTSPVRSYRWAENVHYVLSEEPVKIHLPGLHAEIYAVSAGENIFPAAEFLAFYENDAEKREDTAVALLCEPDAKKASAFSGSGFSYVALGGSKTKAVAAKDKAFYAGGLEAENMTDTGDHGYILGEIQDATGVLLRTEFVPFTSVTYVPLKIKVDPSIGASRLEELTAAEIEKRGTANIYRIHIVGTRKPGADFFMPKIREKYRIQEILDESEPVYDFDRLYEAHTQDMIGYYISQLTRGGGGMSSLDKKAMFYGIDALIKTADKPVPEANE